MKVIFLAEVVHDEGSFFVEGNMLQLPACLCKQLPPVHGREP
jgi:hypothetical protein